MEYTIVERLTAESSTTIAAFKSAILKTLQETAMLQLREISIKHGPFRKRHHVVYAKKRAQSQYARATSACFQLHVLNLHVVSFGCRWVLLHSVIHPSSYYFCPGALVSARKASVFTKLLG